MLIKLRTKFMRKVVSKLIGKAIQSKTGYKVNIQFNDLEARFNDGEITINANLEAKMDKQEFMKIIKSEGLDWVSDDSFFYFSRNLQGVLWETVDCAPDIDGRSLEIVGSNPALFLLFFINEGDGRKWVCYKVQLYLWNVMHQPF